MISGVKLQRAPKLSSSSLQGCDLGIFLLVTLVFSYFVIDTKVILTLVWASSHQGQNIEITETYQNIVQRGME